jgi:hypothetical protein
MGFEYPDGSVHVYDYTGGSAYTYYSDKGAWLEEQSTHCPAGETFTILDLSLDLCRGEGQALKDRMAARKDLPGFNLLAEHERDNCNTAICSDLAATSSINVPAADWPATPAGWYYPIDKLQINMQGYSTAVWLMRNKFVTDVACSEGAGVGGGKMPGGGWK